jgi:endogenous inhibitor of DNA gyrase (YacG/DUF329 family)
VIKVRCPICSTRIEIQSRADLPSFPFCSERCKLVDLGRWFDGSYAIPVTKRSQGEDESNGDGAVPLPQEDDEGA